LSLNFPDLALPPRVMLKPKPVLMEFPISINLWIVEIESGCSSQAKRDSLGYKNAEMSAKVACGTRETVFTKSRLAQKGLLRLQMKKITLYILVLVAPLFVGPLFDAPLFAQFGFVSTTPRPAATGPVFEASVGYAYLDMDTPSRQHVGLSGVDANGFMDFNARWGLAIDASYVRGGNILGTPHSGNVLSGLIGPTFYPAEFGSTRIFVHTLAGVSLVNSAVPVMGTYYLGGTIIRFSYAMGAGVERSIAGPIAVRIGGDYLRTMFANPNSAITSQNNFRLVTSFVYRFGNR
jgi:hypothetical protein